ncbi:hypothetical protein WJX81_004241 [Elliptochloris bilobata]|uniref:Ubiquitin thioesterase OTU n=1 Tax=Elliptochloris bilobata TaxID=381761 RepID=A0AAW1QXC1_9CHLO
MLNCLPVTKASVPLVATRPAAPVLALSAAAVPSFEVLRVPGDGSCLFRALAQGRSVLEQGRPLERDALLHDGYKLRQDVCEAMLARREDIAPFIVGRIDVYVDNMMREGSWGGEPELAVAADLLKRPVLVYRLSGLFGSDLEKVSEYGVGKGTDAPPICLLYSGNHYDLLLVSK